MDGERQALVGIGYYLNRPGVGACQREIFVRHPMGDFQPDARLTAVEAVVVLYPQLAPAGVEKDRIARLDVALLHVLLGERSAEVSQSDLFADIHHAAFHCLDIDKMSAGEQRLQLLDTELLEAIGICHIGHREAVVEDHLAQVSGIAELDADMTEAVELGAGLADFGGEIFVVVDQFVVAERAARRRARHAQHE
jgi:hypothetical protein